jgi:hypothetical protein
MELEFRNVDYFMDGGKPGNKILVARGSIRAEDGTHYLLEPQRGEASV